MNRTSTPGRTSRRTRRGITMVPPPRERGEYGSRPLREPARIERLAPGPKLRGSAGFASGINLLAGIWLVIAPWVLGYTGVAAEWNDVACGVAIALLALGRLDGAARTIGASWVNCLIGIWLLVATFTIDASSTEWINDLILGGVVALLALWSATASADARAADAL